MQVGEPRWPPNPTMNMIEVEHALRELRLPRIADTLSTRVMRAQAAQQPFLETFVIVLQDELDRLRSRLMERHFKRSGLGERLMLADFDWRFNPKVPRNACFDLHYLKFVGEGANAEHRQARHGQESHRQGGGLPGHAGRLRRALRGGRHRFRPQRTGQHGRTD